MLEVRTQAFCGRGHFASSEVQGFLLVLCVVVQTNRSNPTFAADVLLMLEVRTQAFCGRGHFASSEMQNYKM